MESTELEAELTRLKAELTRVDNEIEDLNSKDLKRLKVTNFDFEIGILNKEKASLQADFDRLERQNQALLNSIHQTQTFKTMEKSPNFQNFQKAYHLLISNEEPNYREQFIQGHLKTHFANLMLACQGEFEKVGLFLIGQRKKQYKDYQKALHLTKYEIVSKPSQEKSLNADFQKIVDLASDVQMTKAKSYDTSSLKAKLDKTDKLLEIFGKVFKNLNIDSKHQNEFAILLPSAKQVVIVKIERGKNKDENLANIVTLKTLLLVKQDLKKDLILK